jgi:hypothetical protein
VDLNLYWFDSVSASADESYPAVLRTTASGRAAGVRLETDPPSGRRFVIHGGRRRFGTIRACAAANKKVCVPPNVPEGATTRFEIDVLDPTTRRPLFTEFGDFVQDTQPPRVDAVTVRPTAGGGFAATVDAVDATSSPVAANLWCSLDGGASWQVVGLAPTSDILSASHSRTFTGHFGGPDATTVRYYIVVQDALYNADWYGPGTIGATTIPPPTGTTSGSLSNSTGSALAYSVQTNTPANAFELILPQGASITGTSTPPGFSCTDSGNVEECKSGTVQANTPVTGSFDHTGTIAASCGCVQVAFSADNGSTWFATATLAGPPSDSPPAKTLTSLSLNCPPTAALDGTFQVSGKLTPPFAAGITITYTPPSGPPFNHTATTDGSGNYTDATAATRAGSWTIQASYAGNSQDTPSQSPPCTTLVM